MTPQERRLGEAMDRVAHQRPVPDAWSSIRSRATDPDFAVTAGTSRGGQRRPIRGPYLAVAAIAAVALIAGGVALSSRDGDTGSTEVTVGAPDSTVAERGGTIRYGLPTFPVAGFCLPEVMQDTPSEIVTGALYDPLAAVADDGAPVPYLAESIEPDANHTVWTITLRAGVHFHDGSPLDAAIVKDNIDAWRGAYEGRASVLNSFTLQDVASVEVVDDLTLELTTDGPWVALPAFLAKPSLGIMARAQLDADAETCALQPIGTGPFVMESWDPGGATADLVRNASYWQTAPDGEPYPYLDGVEFVGGAGPADLADERVDVIWTSSATAMAGSLAELEAAGTVATDVTHETHQPTFILLNHAAAPFDTLSMRQALAMSLDRQQVADDAGSGDVLRSDGPFAPSMLGHLEDPGFPSTDHEAARAIVDAYVDDGGSAAFELLALSGTDDEAVALSIERQAEAVGFDVTVTTLGTPAMLDSLIAGSRMIDMAVGLSATANAAIHRYPPAIDPDQMLLWWQGGGNPVNFGKFDDPTIDELLRRGRRNPDESKRSGAYEEVNRHFAEQVHFVWLWQQPAAVAGRPAMGSITGPTLPDGSEPTSDLSLPHRLLGMTAP